LVHAVYACEVAAMACEVAAMACEVAAMACEVAAMRAEVGRDGVRDTTGRAKRVQGTEADEEPGR